MYLELNNLFVFENQNPVSTNIENEIKKLNNTGISECYTSFLNNIYVKILIRRDTANQYLITCSKYNSTTREYNDLIFDGKLIIDNNRLQINYLATSDRNTDILYFKGQEDGEFIKSVYYKDNSSTLSKYVIEELKKDTITCQDEFERLCNQQYYNEDNCVLIVKVNGIGKPQIEKKENTAINSINNILRQQVQKSDGFNYGLYNQLNYSRVVLECQHIDNIRLFQELGSEYFSESKKLYDFLSDFGLELLQNNEPQNDKLQNDKSKQNFAIIPVCADGHISTLLLDLRPNISQQIPERLYSFDSSLYHYDQNIFSGLITEDHKLSRQSLQLTGCCGYWTSCFIEECFEIEDIEEVKRQFETGEMQLKVACKVSEIIDMNRSQHNIGFIKQIHLPLQIADEISSEEYEASNFIEIKFKGTNKYFLLDEENIHKSTCVDLEAIYNLIQQEKSQLEVVGDGLAKLKEQVIKQNQELFNMKQEKIEEIKKQIEPIKEILKMEVKMYKLNKLHHEKLAMLNSLQSVEASKKLMNIDILNKLFCDNLAKFEHLKKRIKLNSDRQREYLLIQGELGYNYSKEYSTQYQLYTNSCKTFKSYNNTFNEYNKHKEELQQSSPSLKDYFEQQQQYYNKLLVVEQRNIKNIRNNYSQIPNINQLQLNKINGCSSEMEKSLDKNLSNNTSKTIQLTE